MACYFLYFLYFLAIIGGNQLLICGVTQPVFKQFCAGERFDSFHSSVCTRYAVAVTGGVVISGVTLGLKHPWLKIWRVSWLAQNTRRSGDLDLSRLTNEARWKTAC